MVKTSGKPAPCWFMSNPFAPGMVYEQLQNSDFEYVVGMDIGHGETLVALYSKKDGEVILQKLNADYDNKIPSYIRFGDGQTLIGKKARNRPGFLQHFKTDPSRWDTHQGGYPRKRLMRFFIQELWKQVLKYNDKLRQTPKEKVMIVVGCPAAPQWTGADAMGQYQDLVRAATRYPHVSILPESTAAILSVIHSADGKHAGQQLRLDRGLAVVDLGSSTIDFTYVVLGKQLITRSLRLGGSDLDKQMLELILEENTRRLKAGPNPPPDSFFPLRDHIPMEQYPEILVELRLAKEQFYPERESLSPKSIRIWGRNPDGSGNSSLTDSLTLEYTITESFMQQVLNRQAFEPEGTIVGMDRSWLELAGQFILNCRNLIGRDADGQLLCDHVLVTGGTSFVTEIMDTVEQTFGTHRTVRSLDPSSSVAKGLAHAKRLDIQGNGMVDTYKASIQTICDQAYAGLLEDLCHYLAGISCDITRDMCLQMSQTPTPRKKKVSDVMDQISQAAVRDPRLRGPAFEADIQKFFLEHFQQSYDSLREKANEVSASIYGANLEGSLPSIPPLNARELQQVTASLNLESFVSKALLSRTVSDGIFNFIQGVAMTIAGFLLEGGNLPAAAVAAIVAAIMGISSVQNLIRVTFFRLPFVTFSNARLADFAAKLNCDDFRKDTIHKLANATAKEILHQVKQKAKLEKQQGRPLRDPRPLYKEFSACISLQAEAILGKLLFLVYDKQPDAN